MTDPHSPDSNPFNDAIAQAMQMASSLSQPLVKQMADVSEAIATHISPGIFAVVEQGTETVGKIVAPIADNPAVKYATKMPGISWLMAALGQVDVDRVERDIAELRQQFPLETPEQLANRVITDSALQAARVGLLTNIAPPVALMLLAVDLTAIAALQAKMIYKIATIYGLSPQDAARRGEVLTIWGLSTGGSSVLKTGLSVVEIIPFLGTAVGITSNAILLYSLGRIACLFYEEKRKSTPPSAYLEDSSSLN
jgi:uncharacterized protein (DUF697 family)